MEIVFLTAGDDDLNVWIKSGNKTILKKISQLIRSTQDYPYQGLGKPEALKHNLTGLWSRRFIRNTGWCMKLTTVNYIFTLQNDIINLPYFFHPFNFQTENPT